MISVSIWLPCITPRSVATSKMTALVGIFSTIVFRSTVAFGSPMRWASRLAAVSGPICRLARARPNILAKLDLPEPKNPEIHTAIRSLGFSGASR